MPDPWHSSQPSISSRSSERPAPRYFRPPNANQTWPLPRHSGHLTQRQISVVTGVSPDICNLGCWPRFEPFLPLRWHKMLIAIQFFGVVSRSGRFHHPTKRRIVRVPIVRLPPPSRFGVYLSGDIDAAAFVIHQDTRHSRCSLNRSPLTWLRRGRGFVGHGCTLFCFGPASSRSIGLSPVG